MTKPLPMPKSDDLTRLDLVVAVGWGVVIMLLAFVGIVWGSN